MAAGDLTTLANVKTWMNVNTTTDDALLTRLITSASAFILSWLNRQLASSAYTETRNGTGTRRLTLSNYPVTAVASLTIGGVLMQTTDYVWDQYGVELVCGTFMRGAGNVVVAYTAGYSVTPPDVEQACIELIELVYKRRGRQDVMSKTQGGEVVSFSAKDMSDTTKAALNQFRRVVQP